MVRKVKDMVREITAERLLLSLHLACLSDFVLIMLWTKVVCESEVTLSTLLPSSPATTFTERERKCHKLSYNSPLRLAFSCIASKSD